MIRLDIRRSGVRARRKIGVTTATGALVFASIGGGLIVAGPLAGPAAACGTTCPTGDIDGDGIPDASDPNVDNDGFLNGADLNIDGGVAQSGPATGQHVGDLLNNDDPNELDMDRDGKADDTATELDIDGDGLADDAAGETDIDADGKADDETHDGMILKLKRRANAAPEFFDCALRPVAWGLAK